jgi:hypothetical protein
MSTCKPCKANEVSNEAKSACISCKSCEVGECLVAASSVNADTCISCKSCAVGEGLVAASSVDADTQCSPTEHAAPKPSPTAHDLHGKLADFAWYDLAKDIEGQG